MKIRMGAQMTEPEPPQPVVSDTARTPAEAWDLLIAGNRRFVAGNREHPNQDADRRTLLAAPVQQPFAVLFGCSDSRLAAEIIFDRGLGDLFVIRTAGHVIGPEVLGSIEYAVAVLNTPLIAVLGHDSCGAIGATLSVLRGEPSPPGFMRDLVARVMLSVLSIREAALADPEIAVAEHVRQTVSILAERSAIIAERLADGRLGIVGMTYQLAAGGVEPIAARGIAL
jgi:carbonic anhydrase